MENTFKVEVPDAGYFERQVSCRAACPVGTDGGGYVRAIAAGEHERAYRLARQPNPFASTCGRICAAPCETACRRGALDSPVTIRALKRVVCERFGVESASFRPERAYEGISTVSKSGRKVAIVGGGPAGLACAHDLTLEGFSVTLFEAHGAAGGMLTLGVPEYRLPREVVQAEIGAIEAMGVEMRFDSKLGRDFHLEDLRKRGFEAVFLGIGAHKSRELAIEGIALDGVLRSVEFLLNIHKGYHVELGRKVVVIGGGNVAFDVARSVIRRTEHLASMSEAELRATVEEATRALRGLMEGSPESMSDTRSWLDVAREVVRKGVPDVHMYCLEDISEIPAAQEEIEEARREGVKLHTRWGPGRILGEKGRARWVELIRCRRVFDEAGKFDPIFDEEERRTEECDTVVLAIGQAVDLSWLRPEDGLTVSHRGTIKTDPDTLATSRPDVFCGGDAAFGPRIAITAVAEGRRAARSILAFLNKRSAETRRGVKATIYPDRQMPCGYEDKARRPPPNIPVDRRIGVAEVERVYGMDPAVEQARRCLGCHVSPIFDGDKCILCGGCADVCPKSCLRLVDIGDLRGDEMLERAVAARYGAAPGRGEHSAIIKDETRCLRCGLCAERCPTGAITMERVEWVARAGKGERE